MTFLAAQRGRESEVSGALDVLETTAGVQVVPGFGAWAYSSAGTLSADGFRTLADGFLDAVRANRDVDGIFFCMHGSMVAADELDPEGRLLEATRAIVGEDVPIVVSLDLHGVLTERMLRQADAVVSLPDLSARRHARDRPARGAAAPADPRRRDPAGDRPDHDPGARPRRRAHHRHGAVRPVHPAGGRARGERGRAGGRGPHQQPVHRRSGAPDQRLRDARRRPGAGGQRRPRPGDRLLGGPRADAAAARVARGGRRAGACHARRDGHPDRRGRCDELGRVG